MTSSTLGNFLFKNQLTREQILSQNCEIASWFFYKHFGDTTTPFCPDQTIYFLLYLIRFALKGSISSRETFLIVVLTEDHFSAQYLMPHSWKGGWFDLPDLQCFLIPAWGVCSWGCCLLWNSLCADIWLSHLSHWLWAAVDRGFCLSFPTEINYLPDQHAEITCPAAMGRLDPMKSWEKWRGKETRITGLLWAGLPLSEVGCLFTQKEQYQTVPSGTGLPLSAA